MSLIRQENVFAECNIPLGTELYYRYLLFYYGHDEESVTLSVAVALSISCFGTVVIDR